ncbi:MAG: hypothetical protein ABIX01_01035 [Chitinophagaceae bacterium]
MPLQYISDNAGNHTAVLIPINEWELLTRKHEDLKQMESLGLIEKDQFDIDFESGMTIEEFRKKAHEIVDRLPWNE